MILPYDSFGKNRMMYTFKTSCVEDASIPYDDGVTTIFLYTEGKEGIPSQELKDMLRYIQNTTTENATNDNLKNLQHMVNQIKKDGEAGVRYMKSWEWEELARREGREDGLKEGKILGHRAGLSEGLREGKLIILISQICRKLQKNKNPNVIADELEEELTNIERICEVAKAHAPEYDIEKIYQALQLTTTDGKLD